MEQGEYEAILIIEFPNGDEHSVEIFAEIYQSVCIIEELTLSETILFTSYQLGGEALIPQVIKLPKVIQEPKCDHPLQVYEIERIEGLVPIDEVFNAINIDNESSSLTIATDNVDIFGN